MLVHLKTAGQPRVWRLLRLDLQTEWGKWLIVEVCCPVLLQSDRQTDRQTSVSLQNLTRMRKMRIFQTSLYILWLWQWCLTSGAKTTCTPVRTSHTASRFLSRFRERENCRKETPLFLLQSLRDTHKLTPSVQQAGTQHIGLLQWLSSFK